MPYTVRSAFDQFRKEKVDLDPEVTQTARKSRDYLFQQLRKLAGAVSNSLPLTGAFQGFGSFARKTKIHPLDDIDFLAFLNGRSTATYVHLSKPFVYRIRVTDYGAPLASFADDDGYVNSTRILYRMRDSLGSVSSYRKAELKKNLQAVVLDLGSYDWSFDIVPAVPVSDDREGTAHYLIPDGYGNWIATDPRIDAANVTRLNTRHAGQFLPTVRLLKYWNNRTHKPVLQAYYFETLALRVFDYSSPIGSFPAAAKHFFQACQAYLRISCPDPKGLGSALDASVSNETKQKVVNAMLEAAQYAERAEMCESQQDNKQAIYWWGRIFGLEFPSYG
jgi:hypothetical protein